jgi:predicted dehydrogenase
MIGAGDRGYARYGAYAEAHPEEIRFVAVAEPHAVRRARFAQAHSIPNSRQFPNWEQLLAEGQLADAALVCTLDRQHVGPALAAMEAGYDVLLEKPMATALADCVGLVQAAERTGRLLQICHVLRYTPFFSTLNEIVTSGRLGEIITVEHRENVVYWHMAHSFVRGSWRSSAIESPMILAKCCHDLDILHWNLGPFARLGSVGNLSHFRAENGPPEAPERCTDGCPVEDKCPWYAPRLYLDLIPLMHLARKSPDVLQRLGAATALKLPRLVELARRMLPTVDRALDYAGWPVSVISDDTSHEARRLALETGPYGRCVYHCDNDVVDHQIVNMETESGTSVVLVMHGHSNEEVRTMRYDGTRATLRGRFAYGMQDEIEIHDHRSGRVERIRPRATPGGHGGGDEGLMRAFILAVHDRPSSLTSAREALESHLMAFAAEEARVSGRSLDLDLYRAAAEVPVRGGSSV